MRLLASLLAALPLAALAQYEPAGGGSAHAMRRSPIYIAVGAGTAFGVYAEDGTEETFREWNLDPPRRSYSGSLNFQIGLTLTDSLLAGFDYTLLATWSSEGGRDTGLGVQSADLVLTWFPQGDGIFLRGGGGLSSLTRQDTSSASSTETFGGANGMVGLGYALPLGRTLNLTLNGDLAVQRYAGGTGAPSSTRTLALYLGLAWY
jgi:hypothetical protein